MSKADATHFDSYREQTRTKHRILAGYLPAYYNVLKGYHKNLVYIDGFAGRGYYMDSSSDQLLDGSPLLAMKLLADKQDFREKIQCFFIEPRSDHYADLKRVVEAQQASQPLVKIPSVAQGTFAEAADELSHHLASSTASLAPTFLFVDPCGVEGVRMKDIVQVLAREWCEAFIFFNYEGVNRIVGLAESSGTSPTLIDLFGTKDRVAQLVAVLSAPADSQHREEIILSAFRQALKEESGAEFMLPFRVESESRRSASHYFLHATKHSLGFKMMKDVMWGAAVAGGTQSGGMQLLQASRGETGLFLPAHLADQESAILAELSRGPRPVKLFREEWVLRPTDLFTGSSYRQCLLRLEREKKILVLDTDGQSLLPAGLRRPHKGEPSLSEKLWVKLGG